MRVATLLASGTELVCALGREADLVAVSHECDWPESVKKLPRVTAPAIDVGGGSAAIDKAVREAAKDALSIYRVDDAALAALKPDLLVTQTQCEVCAVSLKDVEAALSKRLGLTPRVVSLNPASLPELRADMRRVAAALGVPERGEALVEAFDERLARAGARVSGKPKTTVVVIEWMEPLMASGNWGPTLVKHAGGIELLGKEGLHSGVLTWEQLSAADPDALVIAPCGFDLKRTRADLPSLTKHPAFATLRAVKNGRAYLADGNAYLNRPGPRSADAVEGLVDMLHPDVSGFGKKGEVWEPL